MGCGDRDRAQRGKAAGGAEHLQLVLDGQAIAGLHLNRRGTLTHHCVEAGQGLGQQVIFRCGAGGGDGRQDAAPGAGDLFVAGAGQAQFKLCGAVAAKDDVGMASIKAGGQKTALKIKGFAGGRGIFARADPGDVFAFDQQGGVGDQAVAAL